jgi:carbonic anhydrase/acetyltransferase-like protein (isoleucine patch superfamily)
MMEIAHNTSKALKNTNIHKKIMGFFGLRKAVYKLWNLTMCVQHVFHACTMEEKTFVGMGATILDGVVVEKGNMVVARSLVIQKTRIPYI